MLPLPAYDALESAASPTEVGCYENPNPQHEESFIKEMDITLAFFHCSTGKQIRLIRRGQTHRMNWRQGCQHGHQVLSAFTQI